MGGSNFEVKIHPANCQKCCEKKLNIISFIQKAIKSGSAPFIFGIQLISPLPIIHLKEGMDIKSITQLYTETHTVSHVRTRLQGDTTVNAALDCTLNRTLHRTLKITPHTAHYKLEQVTMHAAHEFADNVVQ